MSSLLCVHPSNQHNILYTSGFYNGPLVPRGPGQHLAIHLHHLLLSSIGPIRAKPMSQRSSLIGWHNLGQALPEPILHTPIGRYMAKVLRSVQFLIYHPYLLVFWNDQPSMPSFILKIKCREMWISETKLTWLSIFDLFNLKGNFSKNMYGSLHRFW